jgi:hypothetical protein
MANRGWERIAAAGGIGFVVLQNASQALFQTGGMEPPFAAPAQDILAFFVARDRQLFEVGGYLSALSAVCFLWFLGALWAALRRREPEPAWLALVAAASGVAAVATTLTGGGWALAVFRVQAGLDPQIARLLFDMGNFAFATLWVALASMLLAAGVAALRHGALPGWLAWFGVAVGAGLLAARAGWAASGLAFAPYILFWLWLIAASVVLMRRREVGPPMRHAPRQ